MAIKNLKNISNIPGWHTNHKIIVIESDDWGSIRMPSKEAFSRLKKNVVDLESGDYSRYNHNDTLANRVDFENLFDILSSIKDKNGKSCLFTAISVVANPDFNKIRGSEFNEYHYEPFTATLKKYYPGENVFELWREGISNSLFIPQFHGREHLNVAGWMQSLKSGHRNTLLAFNEGLWGFVPDVSDPQQVEYQAAFQLTKKSDLELHKSIIKEGLDLFESLFGYKAEYFVPPNGPINNSLNKILFENGVRYRSTAKIQHESIDLNKTRIKVNWLGKKDTSGLRYITRNCFFEPSQKGKDWVDSCLNDIETAFRWKKPAIISSHRVNYIGVHDPENRDNTLRKLNSLLFAVKRNYPEIEFMSSVDLGKLMDSEN